MDQLSHLNPDGRPTMVDVSGKAITQRSARARATVLLPPAAVQALATSTSDITTAKGSVFQTAVLAGIMAAKRTGDLIPLCHPLPLEQVEVSIAFVQEHEIAVECTARTTGRTGVEMEALTGATVAALTIYDMCKAVSHDITISQVQLIEKTGGKRDFRRAE